MMFRRSANGNLLVLKGFHGPFYLQVFWPSAGVQSVIIYSLVMLSILLRLRNPLKSQARLFSCRRPRNSISQYIENCFIIYGRNYSNV